MMPMRIWTTRHDPMNPLERQILDFIAGRSHPGALRPTTTEIHQAFGFPACKHALNMLQINNHVRPMTPRRAHGVKRFEVTEAGRQALGRVMAA